MKQPLVSIIVPTRNSASFLEQCLQSIKDQSYTNIELIVVDNNSRDATKEIAKKYTDLVYNRGPERSAQRNFGASKAHGDYLLFIDSDMQLTRDVVKDCVACTLSCPNVKGVVIPEESVGQGFWAECKRLERSFYLGVDWIEAARFFTKSVFEAMGGYDEKNTGTEDFDLPQRIRHSHGAKVIARINSVIAHNERKISLIDSCKKKYYYAQKLAAYKNKEENRAGYKQQASLFNRYRLYLSNPRTLFSNPLVGMGMLFMKTCEFTAGGLGFINANLINKVAK